MKGKFKISSTLLSCYLRGKKELFITILRKLAYLKMSFKMLLNNLLLRDTFQSIKLVSAGLFFHKEHRAKHTGTKFFVIDQILKLDVLAVLFKF